MENIKHLALEAAELTAVDRIRLIDEILLNLENPNSYVMKKWTDESDRRINAYEQGEIKAMEWHDVQGKYIMLLSVF